MEESHMKINLLPQKKQETDGKKKGKKIIPIAFLALFLFILLLIYAANLNSNTRTVNPSPTTSYLNDNGSAIDGTATAKPKDEILDDLKKRQLVVTDKLGSNITFPSGKAGTTGEWIVENPASNNVIQQAEVYFEDLLIAESVPIYPNQHIENIELKQDINPGEYDATVYLN
jgi:hypothetical protein